LALARSALASVKHHMGEGSRLCHSWRAGRRLPLAFLDDYAQMSRASLSLFQATGEAAHLDQARAWIARAGEEFRDPATGGWFLAPAGAAGPVVRPRGAQDGPTPAAVGTTAEVLATLWHLTGEDGYRGEAEATLRAFAGDARRSYASHSTLLVAATLLAEPTQLVVVGEPATPGYLELFRAAATVPVPGRILRPVAPGAELPASHPAAGKHLIDGRAAVYVCSGTACEPPIVEPANLARRFAIA
jgi:uncharacterized protein YyaL (SSP411 family)